MSLSCKIFVLVELHACSVKTQLIIPHTVFCRRLTKPRNLSQTPIGFPPLSHLKHKAGVSVGRRMKPTPPTRHSSLQRDTIYILKRLFCHLPSWCHTLNMLVMPAQILSPKSCVQCLKFMDFLSYPQFSWKRCIYWARRVKMCSPQHRISPWKGQGAPTTTPHSVSKLISSDSSGIFVIATVSTRTRYGSQKTLGTKEQLFLAHWDKKMTSCIVEGSVKRHLNCHYGFEGKEVFCFLSCDFCNGRNVKEFRQRRRKGHHRVCSQLQKSTDRQMV